MGFLFCFIPLLLCFPVFMLGFRLRASHLFVAALMGLAAVLPISVIQFLVPDIRFLEQNSPLLYTLLKSLLLYGLVEEAIKTVCLLPIPHKNGTLISFFLLSLFSGLTLGCFESTVYFLDHLQSAAARGAQLLYSQIFLRIFSTDIIHAACTGICGIFVFARKERKNRLSCLVTAVLIHGFYDFFAGFNNGFRWFSAAVVLFSAIECRVKYLGTKTVLDSE